MFVGIEAEQCALALQDATLTMSTRAPCHTRLSCLLSVYACA